MTDDEPVHPALLPAGLRDLLPPDAETEASSVAALMATFASHGYERVQPPLLEFESSLLAGSGAAVAEQIFRLMDPSSQRMMGLRADTTPQVARIAGTRLAGAPRPLRLSYAGQCLRVRGSQIAPDRQVAQAGIELIGVDSPEADAEVMLVGAEALASLGVPRLSVDLTLPTLAPALLEDAGIEGAARTAVARALDRKDAASVARHGGPIAGVLTDLLLAAGPAERALRALGEATLSPAGRALAERLAQTIAELRRRAPHLRLTVDPVEFRGFRYETGVCATLYAAGRQQELGRGGHYICGDEAAIGLTLLPAAILLAAPPPPARTRVFVTPGADPSAAAALRRQGYATIAALGVPDDASAEAVRLACSRVLTEAGIVDLAADKTDAPRGRESGE